MYRNDTGQWSRHIGFIIIDLICLQLAYILAYGLAGYGFNVYSVYIYRSMALFLELLDLFLLVVCNTMHDVLERGYYREFLITSTHAVMIGLTVVICMYFLKIGQNFSRLTLGLTIILYALASYITRIILKKYMRGKAGRKNLLIISTSDIAENVVVSMRSADYLGYSISGITIIDDNMVGGAIGGVPVVADQATVTEYVCSHWIDEVLINVSESYRYPNDLIDRLTQTGVIVHLNLADVQDLLGKRQLVEKIGHYTVLTTTLNYAANGPLFVKRCMDIVGGAIGCLLTGIVFLFIAPAIYRASPGPIFYSQERVGRNGRKFRMYKFRSMVPDADERKAELMNENKIADGKMFKMDFDPRVIGSRILPDGTCKTGIGDFIRRTSLDEFPQFFNVLKGDMSLVGTRPPLPSETTLYKPYHHARLAIKPGITGLWQVSGRSSITDFEEVVRLDREYIENWNIGLDIKIMLKTVKCMFTHDGAM